jgi:hypothetical protein
LLKIINFFDEPIGPLGCTIILIVPNDKRRPIAIYENNLAHSNCPVIMFACFLDVRGAVTWL